MNSAQALRGAARHAVRRGSLVLTAAFGISFAVNLLRLAGPLFMLLIYDRVLTSRSVETLVALFGLLIMLLCVLGTLDYARKRMLARFGAQFQEQIEETLLSHSGRNQFFQQGRAKPALGLDEVDGLRGFLHSGSLIAVLDFLWTPMFVAVVFVLHPLLGWICVGGIGVICLLMLIRSVFKGGRQERASLARGAIGKLKNAIVASHQTMRKQDMSVGFKERWKTARDDARDRAISLQDWTSWFNSISRITVMVVRYSVLATGAYLTLQGELTAGAMVAATFMVTRVLGPVERFVTQIPRLIQAREQWRSLNQVLKTRAMELEDAYSEQPSTPHRLVVDNVSVRSPLTGALLLRSVSLTSTGGELIEITGTSSQGKTVLAETILGMWKLSSGSILVNGHHTGRLTDVEAQTVFGYAPENPSFLAGTIAENISGLDPQSNPEKVSLAARRARMHAAICALPMGYHTELDPQASCLSNFERNQLALARAFYKDAQILIIDTIDSEMLVRIPKKLETTFSLLRERDNVTIIVLTRQPLNLPDTTRSYTLQDGRLAVRQTKAANQSEKDHNSPAIKPAAAAKMSVVGKDNTHKIVRS